MFALAVGKTLSQNKGDLVIVKAEGDLIFVKFEVVRVVVSSEIAPPNAIFDLS